VSDGPEAAERPDSTRRKEKRKDREWQIERGVAIRAGFYIFGTHLFAGFVWLLFYLGEHAHK
jgi:CO/xanthine dehydrogenase Mo-binding subunit